MATFSLYSSSLIHFSSFEDHGAYSLLMPLARHSPMCPALKYRAIVAQLINRFFFLAILLPATLFVQILPSCTGHHKFCRFPAFQGHLCSYGESCRDCPKSGSLRSKVETVGICTGTMSAPVIKPDRSPCFFMM